MFGRKKEKKALRVMHYEGIPDFATDYPCTLDLTDEQLIIHRIKPETTVTLPRNRITSISAMKEVNFMGKYHGDAVRTNPKNKIEKYYLVISYDKGYLAFWGTALEYGEFIKLQFNSPVSNSPTHIEL